MRNIFQTPRFERATTGTSIVRRNLVLSPTLSNSTYRFSSAVGGSTQVNQTSPAALTRLGAPATYAAITWTSRPNSSPAQLGTSSASAARIPVVPNETYTFSAFAGAGFKLSGGMRIDVGWYDAAGTQTSSVGVAVPNEANIWQRLERTVTAPSTAVSVRFSVAFSGPQTDDAIGSWAGATGFMMEIGPGPAPRFFYGATPNDRGFAWEWEGTADASTSVAKCAATTLRRNLFPDPRLTTLTYANAATTQADYALTSSGVRWTLKTSTSAAVALMPVDQVTGNTYRIMVRARANKTIRVALRVRDARGPNVLLSTDWAWYEATVVAGSGTTTAQTGFLLDSANSGHAIGDWVEISNVLFADGTDVGPYFDGITTPDVDLFSVWEGTANNSASAQLAMNPATIGQTRVTSYLSFKNGKTWIALKRDSSTSLDDYVDIYQRGLSTSLKPDTLYTVMATYDLSEALTSVPAGSSVTSQRLSVFVYLSNALRVELLGTNTPGTKTLRGTFTTPSVITGTNTVRLYAGDNANAPVRVRWTDVLFIEGDYKGPFFDGSSPHATWAGTPFISASDKPLPAISFWDAIKQEERWLKVSLKPS